ncbi:MAG TPA: biotin--[acetyl-CoA-carboxylase] ligase [Mycobacterium sp.]|nr:biotin--[acetyl-CoA-carboxylase] ligase [Mycobacterium sp.]
MNPALDRTALQPSAPWRRIDIVEETGSTNADLLARAAAGEDIAGAVLFAEFQNAGRGRNGRSWATPPRSQIAMSVGVDASGVPPEAWGWLPLLTGVAVVDTIRTYGVAAGLKWPNDVLVGNGKLAGILAEVSGQVVVVGVGLNVGFTADESPDPVATSLTMLGVPDVDRTALAAKLLDALGIRVQRWRNQPGADDVLRADYRNSSATIGTRVRATLPGGTAITGTATDIDGSGRLLIDTGADISTVSAGDISHLRPA